jgi:predicted phosphoadenosine phosphosulfate sulfurtransferase
MKNSEKMNIQKQYFGSPTGVEVIWHLNKHSAIIINIRRSNSMTRFLAFRELSTSSYRENIDNNIERKTWWHHSAENHIQPLE